MSSIWFQLLVRRTDQPGLAPRYQVARFSYRGADVLNDIPREVLGNQGEPVRGEVHESIVRDDGEVKAEVVMYDPTIQCTVQLLGWPDGKDDPSTPEDERWTVLETLEEKKERVEISAKFPKAPAAGEPA